MARLEATDTVGRQQRSPGNTSSEHVVAESLPETRRAGAATYEEIGEERIVGVAQGAEHMQRVHALSLVLPYDRDRRGYYVLRGAAEWWRAFHALTCRQDTRADLRA